MKESLRMAACWLAALACTALAAHYLTRPLPRPATDFSSAEMVILGSSTMRNAVPQYQDGDDTFGSDLPYLRIGMPYANRAELLDLLDQALAAKPRTILLEINPFLFAFAYQAGEQSCGVDRLCELGRSLGYGRRAARDRLRSIAGLPTNYETRIGQAQAVFEPGEREQSLKDIDRSYPFVFHATADWAQLAARVRAAQASDIELILLLPPRSPAATAALGQQQLRELHERADQLSAQLGVPLFSAEDGWQNSQFADLGHMNTSGRKRYTALLAQWLSQRLDQQLDQQPGQQAEPRS